MKIAIVAQPAVRPTSRCTRPPTAPRSEVPGACVVPLGEVHLPAIVSGLLSFGLFRRVSPAKVSRASRRRVNSAVGPLPGQHWQMPARDSEDHGAVILSIHASIETLDDTHSDRRSNQRTY